MKNQSVTINCYRKQEQLLESFSACPDLEASFNLIRFEVQCRYPKVYSMSKGNRYKSNVYRSMSRDELWDDILHGRIITNPIDVLLSDSVADAVIRKYFYKVIHMGDYLTLDGARWMVQAHDFRRDKEKRLISALELINDCRGIVKAKARLHGEEVDEFKRSLKDLDIILVNPVTIPREWGIEHIPNPLRAYYYSSTEVELAPRNEFLLLKLLAEYLS